MSFRPKGTAGPDVGEHCGWEQNVSSGPYGKTLCRSEIAELHRQKSGLGTLSRTLKIEEAGDFWLKRTHPKIRLKGRWLEHAGFKAGNRVKVNYVARGVIELRADTEHSVGMRGVP